MHNWRTLVGMNTMRILFTICLILVLVGAACTDSSSTGKPREVEPLPDDIASLVEMLVQPQQENQKEIMDKLVAKGDEVVPELIQAMSEGGDAQTVAHQTLGRIGKPAVPALIEALGGSDYQIRYGAIMALGEIGPDAVDAVEPLKDLFGRVMSNEQIAIMHTLADITGGDHIIAMLKAALRVEGLRYHAMRVLGDIGPKASSAVPIIIAYLADEKDQTRVEAIESLAGIGPVEGVVDGIAGCLSDPEARVIICAAKALGTFGEDATGATRALADALDNDAENVQKNVARVIGQIAPASRDAIPALIGALDIEDPLARREVADALGQFGPEASSALPALKEASTSDTMDYVRNAALEAIAAIEGTDTE